MFTIGLNIALSLWNPSWKRVHQVETHWLSSEEGHVVFWDMKGPITIDFLEKAATANSSSYCLFLKQNSPFEWTSVFVLRYYSC